MKTPLRVFVLVAALAFALTWGGAAQAAPYLLTGNSGGQYQIGTGLPLPVGTAGIFQGGKVPGTAGTFPALNIPPATDISTGGFPQRVIDQNLTTSQGGEIRIPAGALVKAAAGTPVPIALWTTNPVVFQVATSIDFAWPAVDATLAPGGGPGPNVFAAQDGIISYSGGTKAFGGPGQFVSMPGPGAAGGRVGPNGLSVAPVASVWINAFAGTPGNVTMVGVVGASAPAGVAQPGASVAASTGTTMFGPLTMGVGFVNGSLVPTPTGPFPCPPACPVGSMGTITQSLVVSAPFPSNMVTGSKGFPWTTGFITISQPNAGPAEIFFLSGTDQRVAGSGNISLVSGALSTRALSGPNANRGWLSLTLPEPTAAMGATGALAMLGLCLGFVRRRSH
jgi:hypothetical protein